MSAFSTLRITRKKAIEVMMAQMLGEISNEQLEKFMDTILESRLYNVTIVSDDTSDNDDERV